LLPNCFLEVRKQRGHKHIQYAALCIKCDKKRQVVSTEFILDTSANDFNQFISVKNKKCRCGDSFHGKNPPLPTTLKKRREKLLNVDLAAFLFFVLLILSN